MENPKTWWLEVSELLVLVVGRDIVTRAWPSMEEINNDKWEMSFSEDGSCYGFLGSLLILAAGRGWWLGTC